MEWEHRHLHRETDKHAGEDPHLNVLGNTRTVLDEKRNRKTLGSGLEEHREKRHQHQRRAEHRVEEELERRILTLLAAPHADHEVHRQEHEFKEDEEENQVLGNERAGHARLQNQHEDEERLGVARRGNMVEAVDHHEQGDDHAQEIQRQADAVDADEIRALDY